MDESHLRSTKEVLDYRLNAIDGETGLITDFIVNDEDWQLRYMVVDISKLEPKKQVLVALEWLDNIDIVTKEVLINLKRDAIKFSPPFNPALPVNRQYEEVLYDYYGRPKSFTVLDQERG